MGVSPGLTRFAPWLISNPQNQNNANLTAFKLIKMVNYAQTTPVKNKMPTIWVLSFITNYLPLAKWPVLITGYFSASKTCAYFFKTV